MHARLFQDLHATGGEPPKDFGASPPKRYGGWLLAQRLQERVYRGTAIKGRNFGECPGFSQGRLTEKSPPHISLKLLLGRRRQSEVHALSSHSILSGLWSWVGCQRAALVRPGWGLDPLGDPLAVKGEVKSVKNLRSLLDLFPWKNTVTTNTADSCKSFSLSLSQIVTECGRVHT